MSRGPERRSVEDLGEPAVPGRDALRVERLDTLDRVREHAAAWDGLLARDPDATVFQCAEMFLTWQEAADCGARPFVHLVWRGRELAGLAPLVLRRRGLRGLPVRSLEFGVPRGAILAADDRPAVVESLVRAWEAASGEWDVIALDNLADAAGTLEAVESAARRGSLRARRMGPGPGEAYLPTAGGWDAYVRGRSHNFRRGLRRRALEVRRLGAVSVRYRRDHASVARALDEFFALEGRSWKASHGSPVPDAERRWIRALARSPAHAIRVELALLDLEGQAIAALLWLAHRDRIYALITFYDARYAEAAPGMWLLQVLIQEWFGRADVSEISFVAAHQVARGWTSQVRTYQHLRLHNRRLVSRLLALRDRLHITHQRATGAPTGIRR